MNHDPDNPAEVTLFGDFDVKLNSGELTVIYMLINGMLEHDPEPLEGDTTAIEVVGQIREKLAALMIERLDTTLAMATQQSEHSEAVEYLLGQIARQEWLDPADITSSDEPYSVLLDLDERPNPRPDWLLAGDHASLQQRRSPVLIRNAAWVDMMIQGILSAEHIGIPVAEGIYCPDGLFIDLEITGHDEAWDGAAEELAGRGTECAVLFGRGKILTEDERGVPSGLMADSHVMFHYRGRDGSSLGFMSHPHNDQPDCTGPACRVVHASYHLLAGDMRLTDPERSFMATILPEPS